MGEFVTLTLGDVEVGDYKYYIPLEAIFMFIHSDLIIEDVPDESGDPYKSYRFQTTAKDARDRLDARGVTLKFCKQIYEDFRSAEIFVRDSTSIRREVRENTISFEDFVTMHQKDYYDNAEGYFQKGNKATPESVDVLSLFNEDEWHFDDAFAFFLHRCLLEVIPDEEPVVLDISQMVGEGWETTEEITSIFEHYRELALRRLALDYRVYGFVLEDDPMLAARLRERIMSISDETQFIDQVLLPLLKRMGFARVLRVAFHGHGEFGRDILPFRHVTRLKTLEYIALQAKSVPTHGTAARAGNTGELISQAQQAFLVWFVDELDSERKNVDRFIIATNKEISADARVVIEAALEQQKRRLAFWGIDQIVELVQEHGLVQYVLFGDLT